MNIVADVHESSRPEQWVLFNINRKGTVLYFCETQKSGQSWNPNPKLGVRLSETSAIRLAARSRALAVKSSWLDKVQSSQIAGPLKGAFARFLDGHSLPSMIRNFRSRREPDPLERVDRHEAGGVTTPERPS